jgi:hypothetical protein
LPNHQTIGPASASAFPMRVFAVGIEHALDVAVQRRHDPDPREHRRPPSIAKDQGFHGSLPLKRRRSDR